MIFIEALLHFNIVALLWYGFR